MALNYQRNSYKLWESALNTYNDKETNFVFNPKICVEKTFEELYDGDIRKLFDSLDNVLIR